MGKNKKGESLCYTTLYDSKDRIVDTNDPKRKQDSYYKPASEGGKGGTVDLGAGLRVYFRMAEIQEHDGTKGVQENTVYYMELPQELIPMEKDKDGNKLVDPDDPVTFFKDSDIECVGGIYSCDDGYELQMQFENVEDQLEISGGFQYGVTVSKNLKHGKTETLNLHRLNSNAYSYDRHEGYDNFNPTITYDKEQDMGIVCTAYLDESDYKNENTIVEYSGRCSLVNTLYIDMGGLVSNGSRAGNTNGSDSQAALDAGIEKYEFTFTSQIYDNYNLAGKGYTATAFLMEPEEGGKTLMTAYTGIGRSFGRPSSGYLDDNASSGYMRYEGMPTSIRTNFYASNQYYYGNYYWMEFAPQHY